ncbi:hypothetical protein HDU84_003648 [Entophlyctis sp. JEL0112]|nr:hypothetical protein HDU84_003648 [Entophlyctis sp. JEL0112]
MAGGGTYDDGGVLTLGIVIAEIIVDMNRADLQSIVVKFRSLESLSLENSKGQKTQISHRSLKRLTASNFELVLRSLETCPNLQDVKIPFEFGGHSSRRSLGTLSDAGKNLKHVWIENPDFRGEPSGLIVYFETLSLGAISAEALSAVPTWFTQNKFPGLKHLELDGDFLQLPSKAISSLTYIALETLNLKFFSFEPSHMFDIAEHLQALEHLSFEGCDISAYSERAEEQPSYATLVFYLTSRVRKLSSLHFNDCCLSVSDENNMGMYTATRNSTVLESLHILDCQNPLNAIELQAIVECSPHLTVLRADLSVSLLDSGFFIDGVSSLEILELRNSSFTETRHHNSPLKVAPFTRLKSLTLHGESTTAINIFLLPRSISTTLTQLSLTLITGPETVNGDQFSLRALKTLELTTLEDGYNSACSTWLDLLTCDAKGLHSLEVGSEVKTDGIGARNSSLKLDSVRLLASRCTGLKYFRMVNLQVSKEFLDVFSNSFKYLESFKCFGCPSVPLAKDFQESLNLCIENHRLLSGLYVTVLGPTVGGIKKHEKSHQLMGLNGERTRHIAEIHSDDLKRRFWWLKEVSVFIFDA